MKIVILLDFEQVIDSAKAYFDFPKSASPSRNDIIVMYVAAVLEEEMCIELVKLVEDNEMENDEIIRDNKKEVVERCK